MAGSKDIGKIILGVLGVGAVATARIVSVVNNGSSKKDDRSNDDETTSNHIEIVENQNTNPVSPNNHKNKPNRSLVWRIMRDKSQKFTIRHIQGERVKKGDVLASYITKGQKMEILSSVEGYLYFFTINNCEYGVVADSVDNKDSIKAWIETVLNKKNMEINSTTISASGERLEPITINKIEQPMSSVNNTTNNIKNNHISNIHKQDKEDKEERIRRLVFEIKANEIGKFKWNIQQGVHIKAGKVISTYSANNEWHQIESIQDGYVYFFNIDGVYCGVLSSGIDNKDSIKA